MALVLIPPKATLECQGLGLGMFVGALFPSFLSEPVEKELETGLGPRGQRLGFPPPPWAWGGVEWGWGGFRVKNCRDVSLFPAPGGLGLALVGVRAGLAS